ncbi:MAG: ABC transporter ATP-binding protein/permease [Rectinema sp.]|nr:ABC transporter ATP-binding protein/permease [Rectinema sp.]
MLKEYRTLFPHLKKYLWRYVAGILCLVAVDAAQVLIPRYLRIAVDRISTGSYQLSDLIPSLVAMVLLAVFISIGRFLWRYFINIASRRIEAEMRERLFAHIMKMPPSFFRENTTGDLMARATNDIGTIRQATGMGFVSLVDGVFMSFMILVAMFANNASVAGWIILPLPFITVLILLFGKIVGAQFKKVQDIYGKLSNIAQESLAGIRVVQSFVKERYFQNKFDATNIEYKKATMDLVKTFGFFFPFISFLAGLSTVLLILFGGNASLKNKMSAGALVAMLSYLEMLVWPLMGAGFTVNIVQRGAASLKRINKVLDSEPERDSLPENSTGALSGSIKIQNLSYRYPEMPHHSLDCINLCIPEGSMLGILGKVGSGKSTLLKIFPRIADPGPNYVFLGEKDLFTIPLPMLRQYFSMVPQESFLFSDTIRANILFAAPELDASRFEEIVAISGLDRDVAMFPHGWDTVVGEKGISLSGGQKQRICLARALATDPPVLLLDDALSAVDAETEERILNALLTERKGKTTIVVSNRISTLRNADQIIVLDSGRIIQKGTHETLMMDSEGFYARIAMLQQLEQESCEACKEKEAIDG